MTSRRFLLVFASAFVASAALAATNPPATARARSAAPAKAAAKRSPSAATPAPKLPAMTAERIVKRNVAARGGMEAWRAVNTLSMSGRLDAGGKPSVELPFVMKLKRGHKSRLEVAFKDQTALQVFDGSQGWKVRPFLNRDEVEPYTEAEVRSAASWEELDGPLIDYASKGTRVALVGTETVEGKAAYKLRLTFKSGEQRLVWIDGKTFLERKIEAEPRKLDGKLHRVALHYRAFGTEGGLTTPRVLETVVEGVKPTRKLTITKVTVNEPMADALFGKPQLAAISVPAR
jgi:outer membrane lipoprotein-sorting protein